MPVPGGIEPNSLLTAKKSPWLASTCARVLQSSSSSLRTAAAKGHCCKALCRATLHPRPLCAAQQAQSSSKLRGHLAAGVQTRMHGRVQQQGCCSSCCCCACRCRKAPQAIGYTDKPPAGTNPACSKAAGAHAAAWHPLACLAHTHTHSGSTQVTHRHTHTALYRVGAWLNLVGSFLLAFLARAFASAAATAADCFFFCSAAFFLAANRASACSSRHSAAAGATDPMAAAGVSGSNQGVTAYDSQAGQRDA